MVLATGIDLAQVRDVPGEILVSFSGKYRYKGKEWKQMGGSQQRGHEGRNEVSVEQRRNARAGGKRESKYEHLIATPPGIEPGSPLWEARAPAPTPPQPLRWGNEKAPRKPPWPTAESATFPTHKNPGIEPSSPWRGASSLTTTPTLPPPTCGHVSLHFHSSAEDKAYSLQAPWDMCPQHVFARAFHNFWCRLHTSLEVNGAATSSTYSRYILLSHWAVFPHPLAPLHTCPMGPLLKDSPAELHQHDGIPFINRKIGSNNENGVQVLQKATAAHDSQYVGDVARASLSRAGMGSRGETEGGGGGGEDKHRCLADNVSGLRRDNYDFEKIDNTLFCVKYFKVYPDIAEQALPLYLPFPKHPFAIKTKYRGKFDIGSDLRCTMSSIQPRIENLRKESKKMGFIIVTKYVLNSSTPLAFHYTERRAVVTHWDRIREVVGSITDLATLIAYSFYHGSRKIVPGRAVYSIQDKCCCNPILRGGAPPTPPTRHTLVPGEYQDSSFTPRSRLSLRSVSGQIRRRNAKAGKMGGPRENPPTSAILRHESHVQKSGSGPAENRARFALVAGEWSDHFSTATPSMMGYKFLLKCMTTMATGINYV
ncbi:hypothetical protein PR048_029520, partial [Dryococelus australis]